jgi:predicted nucleic acid-binding protein
LKSINDIIHLKVAEQHCNKLITFDSDFRSLRSFSNIEIEIIS